jgi:serine/threonine protein kinase
MAPETIMYNQYSEKSDVWALGIVYYEMIHGKFKYIYIIIFNLKNIGFPPFKAPSDSSILNLYLTSPI